MNPVVERIRAAQNESKGLPPLPHVVVWNDYLDQGWRADPLTPQQKEENLLHVALWVVEKDRSHFNMSNWKTVHDCGTTYCIGGFANAMNGSQAFQYSQGTSARRLLGDLAYNHFFDSNREGLAFLKEVIGPDYRPSFFERVKSWFKRV